MLSDRSRCLLPALVTILSLVAAYFFLSSTALPPMRAVESVEVQAELVTAPVAHPSTGTTSDVKVAVARMLDTGNLVAVGGLTSEMQVGDRFTMFRLIDEGEASGSVDALDGTPLRVEPWPRVRTRTDPASFVPAALSLTGGVVSSAAALAFLGLFLLSLRPRPEVALDPVAGPVEFRKRVESSLVSRSVHTTVCVVSFLLALLVGGLVSLLFSSLLWSALVFGATTVVLLMSSLHFNQDAQFSAPVRSLVKRSMLPPPPSQPAWVLTLPEGAPARRYLKRSLSPGEVETALVLAHDGAEVTVAELVQATRAI